MSTSSFGPPPCGGRFADLEHGEAVARAGGVDRRTEAGCCPPDRAACPFREADDGDAPARRLRTAPPAWPRAPRVAPARRAEPSRSAERPIRQPGRLATRPRHRRSATRLR